jgi:hypothetical protein
MHVDHQDIVIIGDSYCMHRHSDSDWPKIVLDSLAKKSTYAVRGHGYGGCAWWSVRKRLLKELEIHVPKLLILCHTEHNRLASNEDIGISVNFTNNTAISVYDSNNKLSNTDVTLHKAVKDYYRHLHIEDYHIWAQKAWFVELDTILSEFKEMRVIHMHCFPQNNKHQFDTGITISEYLFNLRDVIPSQGRNHFSKEQNQQIGNRLVELVLDYKPGLQSLNIDITPSS